MNGTIFNIQRFCTNDGPGIRTVIFLKGCPLRCLWCHNPESQRTDPEIMYYKHKCTGCGRCVGHIEKEPDFICYNKAREWCGKTVSTDEALEEAARDKIFYDTSGGGITLSGGEPLYQYDFSLELLEKAKALGLHTAIETCGFTTQEKILAIAEYTDLFLFDYKETDVVLHKKFTGVDNTLILENLRLLNKMQKSVILRCPIVPDCNDRAEHFQGIAAIANELNCIERIDIEPYHKLGEGKYDALEREKDVFDTIPDDKVKEIIDYIQSLTTKPVQKG